MVKQEQEDPSQPTSSVGDAPNAPVSENSNGQHAKSSSNLAAIIGGAVGGVALVALVAILLLVLRRCRARKATYEPHVPRLHDDLHDDTRSHGAANMSAVNPGFATVGTNVPREFLVAGPGTAAHTPGHSAWSDYSSDQPQSTLLTTGQNLRHTDAGVVIPLQRAGSGRLPPAYRSWENGSSTGSDASTNPQRSEVSGVTSRTDGVSDVHTPLMPLRLEEKDPGALHLDS
ncbi:hypothetical protein BC628DRAFT_592248 [Trametes gibbosa]|nr:hypothetical protein BC628DRAFT_592248 [Trametes gibbosa]